MWPPHMAQSIVGKMKSSSVIAASRSRWSWVGQLGEVRLRGDFNTETSNGRWPGRELGEEHRGRGSSKA